MQMWIKKLLLILCLCSACQAANDFSGDANCVAIWRLENGALLTDSKGTNTLTDGGAVADLVDYKEGSASADFESTNTDYLAIADAALDAGYPFKKSDAVKNFSLCFWFKSESLPANTAEMGLYTKHEFNKACFMIEVYDDSGIFRLRIASNNTTYQNIQYDSLLVTGRWYHAGVTYENSDKSYRIRLWDDTAGALADVDKTGNVATAINLTDANVNLGAARSGTAWFDGLMDEVVVFNDILTSDEIDAIRAGTYIAVAPPAAGGQLIMIQEF